MSDNWVVGNLQNALDTWNGKVTELWNLILTSPQNFKGGGIWTAITNVNTAMQGIGTGLLVLFFVIGVVKTCGSFTDLKKPEHAVKLFVRFILAKAVVTQGMELMTTLFGIVQSAISQIMTSAGVSSATDTVLPDELVSAIENCGFWESIPLWAVTLIGGLFITVMSFIMIMSVYGRFVHSYCSHSVIHLCRRTDAECRQELFEKLLCRLFRRCSYRISLHNLLAVRFFAACCCERRRSCHDGMGVHWRTGIQYACACRHG